MCHWFYIRCEYVDREVKMGASGIEQEMGRARVRFIPGASEKNSEQVVASEILNSPCLMVFKRIDVVTLGFILFCVLCSVSITLFCY